MGRALQMDHNLSEWLGQTLARANIKRYVRPPPIVDMELDRRVRLDVRILLHARLLAIRRDLLPIDDAVAVLATDGVHGDVVALDQPDGFQQLHLLFTD